MDGRLFRQLQAIQFTVAIHSRYLHPITLEKHSKVHHYTGSKLTAQWALYLLRALLKLPRTCLRACGHFTTPRSLEPCRTDDHKTVFLIQRSWMELDT